MGGWSKIEGRPRKKCKKCGRYGAMSHLGSSVCDECKKRQAENKKE